MVNLSGTGQGQEPVYWPGLGVLARGLRVALADAETFDESFYFPSGKHLFIGGHSIITLSRNHQNSSLQTF